ncbi:epoxyqueuosine reductase QueH [Patescibacteria group bacterium]|nr:epoxyqueuosine reductase QueH [Patescibacteria group bacterium]
MKKSSTLLHACCAPCSTTALERLCTEYTVHGFFYNPNIHPKNEWTKRANETTRLFAEYFVPITIQDGDLEKWLNTMEGLEKEPEGGKRCKKCFELRLTKTAHKAKKNNFDSFSTTLSVSPYKNSRDLFKIAQNISKHINIPFLEKNFEDEEGYKQSIELSKKFALYRQKYCGCMFSHSVRARRGTPVRNEGACTK